MNPEWLPVNLASVKLSVNVPLAHAPPKLPPI